SRRKLGAGAACPDRAQARLRGQHPGAAGALPALSGRLQDPAPLPGGGGAAHGRAGQGRPHVIEGSARSMNGRVLILAGSDSGGGAGIQADIKTVTALGGFAMTAITALTAQNTLEVRDVLPVPPEFVRKQIDVVLDDIGVDAVKIGMLHDAEVIQAVASLLRVRCAATPLVVDPVMVAESGARLLAEDAIDALKERLIPQATVITPNLPEAEALLGRPIPDIAAARAAAAELRERFGVAVLLKG